MTHKDRARTASKQITKDRAKKNGEFFTPRELIDEMLDKLPAEVWQPGKTFLEPAAGDGNFVIAVIERKLKAGCSPTEALSDVYAVELMLDNVLAMRQRVLNLVGDTEDHRRIVNDHIAHANFLDSTDVGEGRHYPAWLREDDSVSLNL